MEDAASYMRPRVISFEVSARIMIGASAGLTLRYVGLLGRLAGKLAARGVDGGLHVARRGVDVAVQVELQRDAGRAERAGRGHLGDAGDAPELPLQRRGHRGRHGFGAGARQRQRPPKWWESPPAAAARPARNVKAIAPARPIAIVSSVVATGR